MAVFSPKAKQLISAAMAGVSEREYQEIWWSWVSTHPDVRHPGEPWQNATAGLPYKVAVAAVYALEEMARRLRREREKANLTEDQASDLDNDLSHIESVEQFLMQGAPQRRAS